MFWMMNGRNRRGMGGGLFLLPGLMFGGIFGIYAILAVLNVAGLVIGTVFSVLAEVFSGVGSIGGLAIGIVLGLGLFYAIRSRKIQKTEEE